jgi:hypothetical protein
VLIPARAIRVVALLAGLLVAAAIVAAPAGAARADWVAHANEIAEPWPDLQQRDGEYPDYTDDEIPHQHGDGTRYGDSVLGWALIQRGFREKDQRLVDSGVSAVVFAIGSARRRYHVEEPSVFEAMAVAGAYNVMRRWQPNHPEFKRNKRAWETYLKRVPPVSTILREPNTSRFSNHYLVEALEVFELERTGLRSSDRGALLGPGFPRAVRIYRNMINRRIPQFGREKGQSRGGVPTFLISDPPDYPLAYQGLALGFYAEAIRMLGPRASSAARSTLRRAANASWLLSAPDGDGGWFGRSMEESWALTGTALGGEVAANRTGAPASWQVRYRALRERSLERLRDAYGNGPRGYHFIPALHVSDRLGMRALEQYAGAPSFTGLTLLMLNWTVDEMPARDAQVGALATDRDSQAELSRGQSTFASVRRGDNWFAVKQGRSLRRAPGDLRYDSGLVSLKRPGPRGTWRQIVPYKPYTNRIVDSAGPILIPRGDSKGFAWARDMRIRRGVVTLHGGGFREHGGAFTRTGVAFRFAPTGCGVRVSWRAQRGRLYEYSAFLRSYRQQPRITRTELGDSIQRVTPAPAPTKLTVDRKRYYSASDPRLRRVRMRWRAQRNGVLSVEHCER